MHAEMGEESSLLIVDILVILGGLATLVNLERRGGGGPGRGSAVARGGAWGEDLLATAGARARARNGGDRSGGDGSRGRVGAGRTYGDVEVRIDRHAVGRDRVWEGSETADRDADVAADQAHHYPTLAVGPAKRIEIIIAGLRLLPVLVTVRGDQPTKAVGITQSLTLPTTPSLPRFLS